MSDQKELHNAIHMKMLSKSENAKDVGDYTVIKLGFAVSIAEELLKEKENNPADTYICCDEMERALDDHKAIHSQTIGSMTTDSMDSILMYKGGEFKINNRAIIQYCPFCGKPRRRLSEYRKVY